MAIINGTIFNDNNTVNGSPLILLPALDGGAGSDILNGNAGDDILNGGAGSDILNGNAGDDILNGGAGSDILNGNAEDDILNGGAGSDTLNGGASSDTLNGGAGNDSLNGGASSDILTGGAGTDSLTGGAGNDIFNFNSVSDSPAGLSRDVITDFVGNGIFAGDQIDLSTIDANSTVGGNQAFTFIGSGAFTAAGQVRYSEGILQASTDGDLSAEFEIGLRATPQRKDSGLIFRKQGWARQRIIGISQQCLCKKINHRPTLTAAGLHHSQQIGSMLKPLH
ncbi:hemolysin-type calcium-binding region [Nostoc commune NIES-4072]|uniref:Hemolysin-type calcium-binding region n=1 Tax=Nostoc commune NIES-4072 TaxID=2005467 RepID=A0A2R5FYU8_NOSCO|nr:hemolysin-type calcium-binding region [Nostoc commune HK-02]GBG23219.1 hemolysin-type calcium-binding region [Nostoc commune NIES-4072]